MGRFTKKFYGLVLAAVIFVCSVCTVWQTGSVYAEETGYASAELATATDSVKQKKLRNLKAVPVGCTSIKLTWSKCSGADGYNVYRYVSSKGKWVKIKKVKRTSYTIKNLSGSATKYKLAVSAYVMKRGRAVSLTSKKVVSSTTLPAKTAWIREVGAYSISSTSIKWKPVPRATGYYVYRYNQVKKKWVRIAKTTKTSYMNTGLKSGKGYVYRVKAYVKSNGRIYTGAYSASVKTATVPRAVPKASYVDKTVLRLSDSGEYTLLSSDADYGYIHGYKIEFSKTAGASGYIIYYQDVKEGTKSNIKKAKRLMVSRSTSVSLKRTSKKGYTRVFWVSPYYKYGGKTYKSVSKTPVVYSGSQYIYQSKSGKVTSIKEELHGAVDGQISAMKYYNSKGKLKKYDRYIYNKKGFLTMIKTYNAAGKLRKTTKI